MYVRTESQFSLSVRTVVMNGFSPRRFCMKTLNELKTKVFQNIKVGAEIS